MKTTLLSYAKFALPALVLVGSALLGDVAFAEGEPPASTPITVIEVVNTSAFVNAINTIGTAVADVVKAAIGLGLGIFIVHFLYKMLMKFVSKN